MSVRATLLTAVLLFIGPAQPAQTDRKLPQLLDGETPIALTLEAPLKELFDRGAEDENFTVAGTLRYKDPSSGADVELRDLEVSVRGHTSRRETECSFPKLKLKLKGAGSIKIGTHCGEAGDDQLTAKYGRLANDKSPHREALAYQVLAAAGVPTLRARAARITYV